MKTPHLKRAMSRLAAFLVLEVLDPETAKLGIEAHEDCDMAAHGSQITSDRFAKKRPGNIWPPAM